MSLLERIFSDPELVAAPPVLVDVGAAGGVHPVWKRIARYSIGVGFEPDSRESAALGAAPKMFRRWIYCDGLVAPSALPGERREFHLTHSPQCSSLLKPREDSLRRWMFGDQFAVRKTVSCPATSLVSALAGEGIERVDWLKCDTQGLDLSIYLSLPKVMRSRMLAVEFEPGLIDAYQGEDKLWATLRAMEDEPFWLCDLDVGKTPRGRADLVMRRLGPVASTWARRLAPRAPAWANMRYLRDVGAESESLGRRGLLLAWVCSDLLGQHGEGLVIAEEGVRRFGGDLFIAMGAASRRRLRASMIVSLPAWFWRRFGPAA